MNVHHHPVLPMSVIATVPIASYAAFPNVQAPEIKVSDWSYTDFVKAVDRDAVARVKVNERDKTLHVYTKTGEETDVGFPVRSSDALLETLIAHDVKVDYDVQSNNSKMLMWLAMGLEYGVSAVILVALFNIMFMNRGGGGGVGGKNNNPFTFGKSNAKFAEKPDTNTTFADVAGLDNAKQELMEVVEFLRNPAKYTRVGAKIPKGCLLVGSPGTGKTLLARAVAGEAGVPFFSCSASEFVELFVGVGASRVRNLFQEAVKKAPCIVFIDEIDAVGKTRNGGMGGGGFGGGNDEREQTINQLLTEMDGFGGNTGVIVLAATNRSDVLDPALTRPGRFDRQIMVDLPDLMGRVEILKVHTRGKPLEVAFDFEGIAKITAGFSGADLENLCNEAAILAAREDRAVIRESDFDHALEKMLIGVERRSMVLTPERKRLVAIHELGHAITALSLGEYDEVRKVSIIPRGATGGVTLFRPDADRVESGLMTRQYLEDQLMVALGGRVAEEIVYGVANVTTGASGDLMRVYEIARMMVTRYGFSKELGPVAWMGDTRFDMQYSDYTARDIDLAIREVVNAAYKRTRKLLMSKREKLLEIAEVLMERENMTGEEVRDAIFGFSEGDKGDNTMLGISCMQSTSSDDDTQCTMGPKLCDETYSKGGVASPRDATY
jgi:cell division protease FtsH